MQPWSHWLVPCGVCDISFRTEPSRSKNRSLKLICTDGNIFFQGVETFSATNSSPFIYCAPEGSQSFADFSSPEKLTAIAPLVNARDGKSLVMIALGTNSQISMAWRPKHPNQYKSDLSECIAVWGRAISGEKKFVHIVPPKPRVDLPYARYEDYVDVTMQFAKDNPDVHLIRTDMSVLGTDNTDSLYSEDGVHLNSSGHIALASVVCEGLGIGLDARLPRS